MVKKTGAKRVGANRRRLIEERRAQRPRVIMRAARKTFIAVAAVAAVAAVGYVGFTYVPNAANKIYETDKKSYRNVKIINCDAHTQARLKNVFDSLITVDSFSFNHSAIIKAAATIHEIEKISVKKYTDKTNGKKTVLIKVIERKPVALVHSGEIFLVDKFGVRFTALPGQFYDLPLLILDRKTLRDTIDLDVFNAIRKASLNLGSAFFRQMSQIDVSGGDAVKLFFRSGEAQYALGYEDMDKKLVYVKKIRERLLEMQTESVCVNLMYHNLAFVKAY